MYNHFPGSDHQWTGRYNGALISGNFQIMMDKGWFIERMKAKLGSWETTVDQIQANADHVDPRLSYHYSATILDIIGRIQQIEKILNKIMHSKNDSWQDIITSLQSASDELDKRVRLAATLFLQARHS